MAPRGTGGRGARGQRAGGRQRLPVGVALLLPVLAAAAGLSLQPGRMRHLGVCPNQLNPNLWVDAQSTCERECQADQVSEGAAGAAGGNGVWGASPGPRRRCFGVRVLCRVPQLVQSFQCNGLSPAAALPPKPLLSAGLLNPPQAEKLLVSPSCQTVSHGQNTLLVQPHSVNGLAGMEGRGVLGHGPQQAEDRILSQLFPGGRSPPTDRAVHPREPWL